MEFYKGHCEFCEAIGYVIPAEDQKTKILYIYGHCNHDISAWIFFKTKQFTLDDLISWFGEPDMVEVITKN